MRQVESGQTPKAVGEAAGVCPRSKRKAGVWDAIIAAHDGNVQIIDSSIVRVHQQAAAQRDAFIGRSHGGLPSCICG